MRKQTRRLLGTVVLLVFVVTLCFAVVGCGKKKDAANPSDMGKMGPGKMGPGKMGPVGPGGQGGMMPGKVGPMAPGKAAPPPTTAPGK